MIFITRQDISIRKGPLYFIAALFMLFLFILYDTGKIHDGAPVAVLIGIVVFAVIYYLLSKRNIIIDNDGITQELFFGKTRHFKWSEIKSSDLKWHFHGHGANLEWSIVPVSGKAIHFQPSFYNRKNLRWIAEAIVDKCPNTAIDQRIQNIAAGKFPWYIF